MPISIEKNYKYILDLVSKNNGQFLSPKEYERYANIASLEMFDDFAGIKSLPKVTYGKNRLVDQRLNPFRKRVQLNFVDEYLTKPTGLRTITAVYTTGQIPLPVRPTDEDRLAMLFSNPLAAPDSENIYYIEEDTKLRLLGDDDLAVWVEYLKKPVEVVYAYTLNDKGRPVFSQAGSVDFEWDTSEEAELSMRILEKMGISMKDQLEIQVAQNSKNQE